VPMFCPHCGSLVEIDRPPGPEPAAIVCPVCGASFALGQGTRDRDPSGDWPATRAESDRGPPATRAAPPPPQAVLRHFVSLGPYRIHGVVGHGGMGVVYRARHETTGEAVAVKTVMAQTQALLQRIRREMHALGRLRHPGLVRIIDTGVAEGVPWYAMELLEGPTLHALMRAVTAETVAEGEASASLEATRASGAGGPEDSSAEQPAAGDTPAGQPGFRDLAGFLTLVARLCSALAYLHGEGIVHRDLKPGNVLLRPDGDPVLVDFGLAARVGTGGREVLEVADRMAGTPAYMAPEQIRGEYADARADLYAVGCILYAGVTGRRPFEAADRDALLHAHTDTPPVPPRQLVPELAPDLDSLILRLLAKHGRDRLGHATDVVAALARLGADPGDWLTRWPPRDYLYRPGFVGRGPLLDRVREHIARAQETGAGCVFLHGESGVGKTRLILELARGLERSGVRVFTGECLPVNGEGGGLEVRANPLHPFRPLLQAVADYCVEGGPAEFQRLLGPRAAILASVEPALAHLPGQAAWQQPRPADEAPAGDIRYRLLDALRTTLAALARRWPCVVFLDDLQWADELTLDFLALCHSSQGGTEDSLALKGLAIVGAYRSEEQQETFGRQEEYFATAPRVAIGRFDEPAVGAIVADMLATDQPDARFVRFLARHSEGNPFFIAEYLRTAVTEGVLRRNEAGRWHLPDLPSRPEGEPVYEALTLPSSLRQLVARRLHGLPASARVLLELAAVIGREVDGDLLQAPGLLAAADYLEAVNTLVTRQIFEERQPNRFRFAHDKLRETAYEEIAADRRRHLHRLVALAIEQRYAASPAFASLYPALAHHWRQALDPAAPGADAGRAIDYLEKAVNQALYNGMPRQAVEFGLEAARLLGVDLPTTAAAIGPALEREMEEVGRLLAERPPAQLPNLPPADAPEITRAVAVLLAIHPAAHESHQFSLFALMAAKNMSLTLRHGQGPLSPAVYAMFAIVTRQLADDSAGACTLSRLALDLGARRPGPTTPSVSFVHTWFISPWVNPLHDCLPSSREGARVGLEVGDLLYGCYHLAVHVMFLGCVGAPLAEVMAAARRHREQVNGRVTIAAFHCTLELQTAKALAGLTASPLSLTDAEHDEGRDLEWMCRTDNYTQMAYYFIAKARLAYYFGDHEAALAYADRALPVLASFQAQIGEVELRFYHALALCAAAGRSAAARDRLLIQAEGHRARLERWAGACPANFEHKARLVAAELARRGGRPDEALRLYDEAAGSALRFQYPHHAALAWELAGDCRFERGDIPAARDHLARACQGYRDWGALAKVRDLERRLAGIADG
jgi:serine/threonine protein kinase/predicted ATPase